VGGVGVIKEEIKKMLSMQKRRQSSGFTLLEVMVAVAIIAIALTAVLGSQSQSVSLASEAKFNTTASLLAQSKMAEMEIKKPEDLASDSGDFGEDFPGYTWQVTLSPVIFGSPENVADHLSEVEIEISWGEDERYKYIIRQYLFVPKSE
jgi:general secretion pathway protein I